MGLFGNSYHQLCEKAIEALEGNDIERASKLLLAAIAKDNSQPRAFHWLGMTYNAASSAFAMQGDSARQIAFGEQALRAFDDAIKRETDAPLKAEQFWQRAAALRGLNRTKESEDSLAHADEAVPGFLARRHQEMMQALENAMKNLRP
jgi:tetratricopeptide (TPR) repeat protein